MRVEENQWEKTCRIMHDIIRHHPNDIPHKMLKKEEWPGHHNNWVCGNGLEKILLKYTENGRETFVKQYGDGYTAVPWASLPLLVSIFRTDHVISLGKNPETIGTRNTLPYIVCYDGYKSDDQLVIYLCNQDVWMDTMRFKNDILFDYIKEMIGDNQHFHFYIGKYDRHEVHVDVSYSIERFVNLIKSSTAGTPMLLQVARSKDEIVFCYWFTTTFYYG